MTTDPRSARPGLVDSEPSSSSRPEHLAEPPSDVTALLVRWQDGDDGALAELTPLVYRELHQLAHAYMRRERSDDLLQTTALVNEAFIRLVGLDTQWECRRQFFAVSAQIMRRILVDYARRRKAEKRGGPVAPLQLGDLEIPAERAEDLVALDDAMSDLESLDPRKAKALELHYFGGMTATEIGDALDISQRTAERDLRLGRAWIADAMGSP